LPTGGFGTDIGFCAKQLQEKKRQLAAAALSGDKLKNMRLGMDDLLALFRHGGKDDDEDD
jgi:hypothetical protein